jgi:alginate O-acetyltransferase complex protein AlgI
MSFQDPLFLLGFAFLLFYLHLMKRRRKALPWKWGLLIANFLFLTSFDYRFSLVLLGVILVTWATVSLMRAHPRMKQAGILFCLLLLGFTKYCNFFLETFSMISGLPVRLLTILLPLGVSYYTFSAIGYILDVSWEKQEPMCFLDTALFLSYFPKLIAGPLMRSTDFKKQLENTNPAYLTGCEIFLFGAFKKYVFADHIAPFVDTVFSSPALFGGLTMLEATIGYMVQLYFDFSGYCDMACGLSLCVGITLPKNFDLPYLSATLQDYWHRWHITMATWFKDYLFLPLSLSPLCKKLRKAGKTRIQKNLFPLLFCTLVVWTATGLWHGPSWNYVLWGLYHGILLSLSLVFKPFLDRHHPKESFPFFLLQVLRTFLIVTFGEIIFRSESLPDALSIIQRIFLNAEGATAHSSWLFLALLFLVAGEGAALLKAGSFPNVHGWYPTFPVTKLWGKVLLLTAVGVLVLFSMTSGGHFIYGAF